MNRMEDVNDAERELQNFFETLHEKWNLDDFCRELKKAENENDIGEKYCEWNSADALLSLRDSNEIFKT